MNTAQAPLSPITGSSNIELEEEFAATWLVDGYRETFGVDVSRFFDRVARVRLYRCESSGYRFFYPFTLAGDGEFYARLQAKLPWYYEEWRHEHDTARYAIPHGASVLEIGCGTGGFVARLRADGWDARGLELNGDAVAAARQLGRPVLGESMAAHASRDNRYDVVCAFQTLEHIPHPAEFVREAKQLLCPGGWLIVAVPNNAGYLRWVERDWLNFPPHHMGRWDASSLERVAPWFGLEVKSVCPQRLQPEHVRGWVGALETLASHRSRLLARTVFRAGRSLLESAVATLAPSIDGHTVMAVYSAPPSAASSGAE